MVPGSWYTQYRMRFPNENRIHWLWLLCVYAILKVAAIEGYGMFKEFYSQYDNASSCSKFYESSLGWLFQAWQDGWDSDHSLKASL